MSAHAEIIAELRRVLNERDEAREQLDLTKRELGRWVDREAKAVRERDEALARCETLRELADAAAYEQGLAQRRMMDAQRERDEARAELSKLREDYDSVLEANVGLLDGAPYVDARAAFRRGAEAMRARCEEIARHACSVIGKLEHTYGIMTQGHIETVSRLILEVDIPEEP